MKKNKLIGLLLVAVSINTYVSSSNNNLDVGIIKKENKLQNVLSNEENGWNITNVLYKELSFDAKKVMVRRLDIMTDNYQHIFISQKLQRIKNHVYLLLNCVLFLCQVFLQNN